MVHHGRCGARGAFLSLLKVSRLAAGCLLVCGIAPAYASGTPQAVVVVVPGLRADDLTQPELKAMAPLCAEGASGWMVCRAAEPPGGLHGSSDRDTDASLLLTLGSGARAYVPSIMVNAGLNAEGASSLTPSGLSALRRANSTLDHAVAPGATGALFHAAGLTTAVISDASDAHETLEACLLAMDPAGRIDLAGPRLHCVLPDVAAPWGIRADVPALLSDLDRLPETAGLVDLTYFDLDRADRYAERCLPAAAAEHRARALQRVGALMAGLLDRCRSRRSLSPTWLILLAPGPASTAARHDRLAPIVVWGRRAGAPSAAESVSAGAVTSGSTHRVGLVVDTDLLPTLAGLLGLPAPPGSIGRALRGVPTGTGQGSTPAALRQEYVRLMNTAALQDAYGGLPTVQLLLALGMALALYSRTATRRLLVFGGRGIRWVGGMAVASAALPLGMLILPPVAPSNVWGAGALLGAFVLLAAIGSALGARRGWFRPVTPLYALCAALVAVALVDLLCGMRLMRDAWMSYSVVEGARFYGIGNEYMGVLIGAGCVLLPACAGGHAAHGRPFWSVAGLYAALLLAMGLPQFGAKVGAIPSAGCAFGAALIVWRRGRLQARDLGLLIGASALLLAGFALLDLRHAVSSQSHLARALTGSGGGLLEIARRKLLLEGRLLLRSPWSAAMAVAAMALTGLWRRAAQCEGLTPGERAAFAGLAVGAIASLCCNDSGVMAAAMTLLLGLDWAAAIAVTKLASPNANANA